MKLISFVVPAYNSEKYLNTCIDSLLFDLDKIEIIIVNDGSKDNTIKIAEAYKHMYPNTVKVINKLNGGHGSGINAGLEMATGLYFKVVDSDDWMDVENTKYLVNKISQLKDLEQSPDVFISDFIYEHVEDQTHFIRSYKDYFIHEQITTWNDSLKKFRLSATLLMHALTYKTQVLRNCGLQLPEHTFYVDNIFAYQPLAHTTYIYYIPKVMYHYYIGRADQSVQMHHIVNRYDQQIRVMRHIMYAYNYKQLSHMPKGLKQYMFHNLAIIMVVTQMFTTAKDTKERRDALSSLWKDLKSYDRKMYYYLKYRSYNSMINFLPFKAKGFVTTKSYLYLTTKVKLG